MRFDIITIFPEVIAPYVETSILGRAQKNKIISIKAHNLRDYTLDSHHKVDDTPYGGGPGMVMSIEPIDRAVEKIKLKKSWFKKQAPKIRVISTSAAGKRFVQADAERLSAYEQIIFICGRYEGIDARVDELVADESLSIGDFVLTGGELPAMVMVDAISRLIPGVLGNSSTLAEESHSVPGVLEYPQYTKPPEYKGKKVPEVLLSGDHGAVAKWRSQQAKIIHN